MKKIFLILIIILGISDNSVNASILEANASYNWVSRSQVQRDEDIINIHEIISKDVVMPQKFDKITFKTMFAPYLKDSDAKKHYLLAKNYVKETDEYKLAGFFKGSLLIMYGIQYKNDLKYIYYYDVYGNLRYLDILSNNFPQFPYYSKQYKKNGNCVGIFYYLSSDTQFIYTSDYEFKGLWQEKQMYDKKAKKLLTRSNY